MLFFFFKQKTAYEMRISDWSSDVCSSDLVDENGNMHVPEDYLRTYRYLGTWAVLADEGHGANELHVVYASPGTVDTFQKSGQFPDDAVLVKEVYEIGRASGRDRVYQYV